MQCIQLSSASLAQALEADALLSSQGITFTNENNETVSVFSTVEERLEYINSLAVIKGVFYQKAKEYYEKNTSELKKFKKEYIKNTGIKKITSEQVYDIRSTEALKARILLDEKSVSEKNKISRYFGNVLKKPDNTQETVFEQLMSKVAIKLAEFGIAANFDYNEEAALETLEYVQELQEIGEYSPEKSEIDGVDKEEQTEETSSPYSGETFDSFTHDASKKASLRMKMFLATIQKPNYQKQYPFGLPEFEQYSKVYNTILKLIHEANSYDEMVAILENKANAKYIYKVVLEKLKSKDTDFKREFFAQFSKQQIKYVEAQINIQEGSFKLVDKVTDAELNVIRDFVEGTVVNDHFTFGPLVFLLKNLSIFNEKNEKDEKRTKQLKTVLALLLYRQYTQQSSHLNIDGILKRLNQNVPNEQYKEFEQALEKFKEVMQEFADQVNRVDNITIENLGAVAKVVFSRNPSARTDIAIALEKFSQINEATSEVFDYWSNAVNGVLNQPLITNADVPQLFQSEATYRKNVLKNKIILGLSKHLKEFDDLGADAATSVKAGGKNFYTFIEHSYLSRMWRSIKNKAKDFGYRQKSIFYSEAPNMEIFYEKGIQLTGKTKSIDYAAAKDVEKINYLLNLIIPQKSSNQNSGYKARYTGIALSDRTVNPIFEYDPLELGLMPENVLNLNSNIGDRLKNSSTGEVNWDLVVDELVTTQGLRYLGISWYTLENNRRKAALAEIIGYFTEYKKELAKGTEPSLAFDKAFADMRINYHLKMDIEGKDSKGNKLKLNFKNEFIKGVTTKTKVEDLNPIINVFSGMALQQLYAPVKTINENGQELSPQEKLKEVKRVFKEQLKEGWKQWSDYRIINNLGNFNTANFSPPLAEGKISTALEVFVYKEVVQTYLNANWVNLFGDPAEFPKKNVEETIKEVSKRLTATVAPTYSVDQNLAISSNDPNSIWYNYDKDNVKQIFLQDIKGNFGYREKVEWFVADQTTILKNKLNELKEFEKFVKAKKNEASKEEKAAIDYELKKIAEKIFSLTNSINALQDSLKSLKAFDSGSMTDAQEYATLKHYLQNKVMLGRISEETAQKVYDYLKNEDADLSKMPDYVAEVILTPEKYLQYGLDNDNKIIYVKSSTIPIIPALFKGTELLKIAKLMEENGVDRLAYTTAVKSAYPMKAYYGPEMYTNNNGNITLNSEAFKTKLESGAIYSAPRANLAEQSQVPPKTKTDVPALTQVESIIVSDPVIDDDSYMQLMDEYRLAQGDLQAYKHSAFYKKLGIKLRDVDNNIYEPTPENVQKSYLAPVIESRDVLKRFATLIYQQFAGKTRADYLAPIEEVLNEKSSELDLTFHPALHRIMPILYSVMNKSLIKTRLVGTSVVQVSEGFIPNPEAVFWLDGKTDRTKLNAMLPNKDGKSTPGEIILSANVIMEIAQDESFYNEDGSFNYPKMLEWANKNKELLSEIIAVRIPSQSMKSMVSINVVGILPPSLGNVAIIPAELVVQMGGDFDVDKIYMYIKALDEEGKIAKIAKTYEEKEEAINKKSQKRIIELLEERYPNKKELLNKSFASLFENLIGLEKLYGSIRDEKIDFEKLFKKVKEIDPRLGIVKGEVDPGSAGNYFQLTEMITIGEDYLDNELVFDIIFHEIGHHIWKLLKESSEGNELIKQFQQSLLTSKSGLELLKEIQIRYKKHLEIRNFDPAIDGNDFNPLEVEEAAMYLIGNYAGIQYLEQFYSKFNKEEYKKLLKEKEGNDNYYRKISDLNEKSDIWSKIKLFIARLFHKIRKFKEEEIKKINDYKRYTKYKEASEKIKSSDKEIYDEIAVVLAKAIMRFTPFSTDAYITEELKYKYAPEEKLQKFFEEDSEKVEIAKQKRAEKIKIIREKIEKNKQERIEQIKKEKEEEIKLRLSDKNITQSKINEIEEEKESKEQKKKEKEYIKSITAELSQYLTHKETVEENEAKYKIRKQLLEEIDEINENLRSLKRDLNEFELTEAKLKLNSAEKFLKIETERYEDQLASKNKNEEELIRLKEKVEKNKKHYEEILKTFESLQNEYDKKYERIVKLEAEKRYLNKLISIEESYSFFKYSVVQKEKNTDLIRKFAEAAELNYYQLIDILYKELEDTNFLIKAAQNTQMELMNNIILHPRNFFKVSGALDSSSIKDALGYINSATNNKKSSPTIFTSPQHQLQVQRQNSVSKSAIGVWANIITMFSKAVQVKLEDSKSIQSKYKNESGSVSTSLSDSMHSVYTDINFSRLLVEKVEDTFKIAKAKNIPIFEAISNMMTASVDGAKDPVLNLINMTLKNINVWTGGIISGIAESDLIFIMTLPIMKDNALELDLADSAFSKKGPKSNNYVESLAAKTLLPQEEQMAIELYDKQFPKSIPGPDGERIYPNYNIIDYNYLFENLESLHNNPYLEGEADSQKRYERYVFYRQLSNFYEVLHSRGTHYMQGAVVSALDAKGIKNNYFDNLDLQGKIESFAAKFEAYPNSTKILEIPLVEASIRALYQTQNLLLSNNIIKIKPGSVLRNSINSVTSNLAVPQYLLSDVQSLVFETYPKWYLANYYGAIKETDFNSVIENSPYQTTNPFFKQIIFTNHIKEQYDKLITSTPEFADNFFVKLLLFNQGQVTNPNNGDKVSIVLREGEKDSGKLKITEPPLISNPNEILEIPLWNITVNAQTLLSLQNEQLLVNGVYELITSKNEEVRKFAENLFYYGLLNNAGDKTSRNILKYFPLKSYEKSGVYNVWQNLTEESDGVFGEKEFYLWFATFYPEKLVYLGNLDELSPEKLEENAKEGLIYRASDKTGKEYIVTINENGDFTKIFTDLPVTKIKFKQTIHTPEGTATINLTAIAHDISMTQAFKAPRGKYKQKPVLYLTKPMHLGEYMAKSLEIVQIETSSIKVPLNEEVDPEKISYAIGFNTKKIKTSDGKILTITHTESGKIILTQPTC